MKNIRITLLLGACGLVYAQATKPAPAEKPAETTIPPSGDSGKIAVAKTETADFPAGGTLRLKNAVGELTITGWDQPNVEITTIKSTKSAVDAKDHDRMAKLLDNVKVTLAKNGNEVTVSADYPKHSKIARPFYGMTDFDLEYRIHVPRGARLAIQQNMGETHIENITGEIQADDHMGEITVQLPEGQYSIDAKSKFGAVESDFPGTDSRKKFVGHAFVTSAPAAAQKLTLRAGYGDIVVEKMH